MLNLFHKKTTSFKGGFRFSSGKNWNIEPFYSRFEVGICPYAYLKMYIQVYLTRFKYIFASLVI